jgi:hypothetical protein
VGDAVKPQKYYVLMDIGRFWEDSHRAPASVVGLYGSLQEAKTAATRHRVELDRDGLDLQEGEPDPEPVLFEPEEDAVGVTLVYPEDHDEEGTMAYRIELVEVKP